MINWTQRMQEVQDIIDLNGGVRPTYASIARQLGLSVERSRQIFLRVERFRRQFDAVGDEGRRRRRNAAYANEVLRLIASEARYASAARKREQKRATAIRAEKQRRAPLVYRHLSQEELRALAKTAHWADVVYESGTDRIISVRNRW